MRFVTPTITAVVLILMSAGCGKSPAPTHPTQSSDPPPAAAPAWQIVEEADLSKDQLAQRDRVLAARDELMTKLKGRLMEVVSKDGIPAAISVCKEDAPRLAREVSQQHKLSIGRTSFRLRNQANQPPNWANVLVMKEVIQPTYLASEGKLAALLPIFTGPLCVNCHGTKDGISADVLSALAEQYPDDEATGFQEGELRGWFWVEVAGP